MQQVKRLSSMLWSSLDSCNNGTSPKFFQTRSMPSVSLFLCEYHISVLYPRKRDICDNLFFCFHFYFGGRRVFQEHKAENVTLPSIFFFTKEIPAGS